MFWFSLARVSRIQLIALCNQRGRVCIHSCLSFPHLFFPYLNLMFSLSLCQCVLLLTLFMRFLFWFISYSFVFFFSFSFFCPVIATAVWTVNAPWPVVCSSGLLDFCSGLLSRFVDLFESAWIIIFNDHRLFLTTARLECICLDSDLFC